MDERVKFPLGFYFTLNLCNIQLTLVLLFLITVPIEYVDGVLGGRGRLPCDVHVPSRDDKLQMVLWFRDKDAEPIYR